MDMAPCHECPFTHHVTNLLGTRCGGLDDDNEKTPSQAVACCFFARISLRSAVQTNQTWQYVFTNLVQRVVSLL